jgi:hypothetical protein
VVECGALRPEEIEEARVPGKDIFLSYASDDRPRILQLVRALEAAGWTVFWDRKIPTSKRWPEVVEAEITTCRSVVVVWTEKSVASRWVQKEAREGERRNVLFPIRIDDVEPPFEFRDLQAAELVGWDGSTSALAFQEFVKDLKTLLSEPPVPRPLPQPITGSRRAWFKLVLSLAGVTSIFLLVTYWQASRSRSVPKPEPTASPIVATPTPTPTPDRTPVPTIAPRAAATATPEPATAPHPTPLSTPEAKVMPPSKPSPSVSPTLAPSRPTETPALAQTVATQSSKPIRGAPTLLQTEDVLIGHWISTFENPLFSVIDISREGSDIRVRAYVNNRGPDKGGCVYDTILDVKRGVFAKGKAVEWQLPTLPLPCANWVPQGFTGASLSVSSLADTKDTLGTVVTMYAGQKVLGGSGPTTYMRK